MRLTVSYLKYSATLTEISTTNFKLQFKIDRMAPRNFYLVSNNRILTVIKSTRSLS